MKGVDDFERALRRDADILLGRILAEQSRVVTRRRRWRVCVAGGAAVGAGLLLATFLHDRVAQPNRPTSDAPTVAHDSTPEVPSALPRIEMVDRPERRVLLEYLSDMEVRAELVAGGFDLDLVEIDGRVMLVGRE